MRGGTRTAVDTDVDGSVWRNDLGGSHRVNRLYGGDWRGDLGGEGVGWIALVGGSEQLGERRGCMVFARSAWAYGRLVCLGGSGDYRPFNAQWPKDGEPTV